MLDASGHSPCVNVRLCLTTNIMVSVPSDYTAAFILQQMARMDHTEEYYEDPSSLPYIISPVSLISFVVTLVCPLVLSPLLWPWITPMYHSIGSRRSHFNTLLSSTIHAVVVSDLTVYALGFGLLGTNRVFSKSMLGFTILQVSIGYFVADFVVCLFDPLLRRDLGSMLHHIAAIIAIYLGLLHQGKFMFFIVYRLVAELSTPFVNLRWVYYTLGKKRSKRYIFASFGMMISFFFCRIVVIPWHWYEFLNTITDPASSIVPLPLRIWTLINFGVFDMLNAYWFSKMVDGAVKLFRTNGKDIS